MIEIVEAEPLFEIKVRLDKGAKLPEKSHSDDAGYDLFAVGNYTVPPTIVNNVGSAIISTGVHIELPHGFYARVDSRSGLNFKHGMTTTGIIDAGYRGEIKVKLYNHTQEEYKINNGDRVAQLIIEKLPEVKLIEVNELSETDRSSGGFGSTGR